MNKLLALLIVTSLILTGCDKEKENVNKNNTNNDNNQVVEENNTQKEPEEDIKIEQPKEEDKKDNSTNTSDSNTQETTKPEEPKCTAKKFKNKYSYAYSTKEECISKGNNAFMDVYDNIDDTVFTYGCEQIVDDCGTTWYGVYFNRWSDTGGDDVVRVYY